jgi:hypothetical protein
LEINSGAHKVTADGSFTVGGALTVNGGTFSVATGVALGVTGNCTLQTAANSTLEMLGTASMSVGGNFTVNTANAAPLALAAGSTVTLNGSAAQAIGGTSTATLAFGKLRVANTGNPATVAVTVNDRSPAVDLTTAGTVAVDDGRLAVAGGAVVSFGGNLTVTEQFELGANSVLRMANGTSIQSSPGSLFKATGTSMLPGGYATIQGLSVGDTYSAQLQGDVNVHFACIYDLNASGLTLSGTTAGTTIFDNTYLYNGHTCYLHVTGSSWNQHDFRKVQFHKDNRCKTVEINIAPAAVVYVNEYATDSAWTFGDATDIETSGKVLWSPTFADDMEAHAEQVPRGALVTWKVSSERMTVGYRVLRREAGAAGEFLAEELAEARGARAERLCASAWLKLAEVPSQSFGGEPAGLEYWYLDQTAAFGRKYEYQIQELGAGNGPGAAGSVTMTDSSP